MLMTVIPIKSLLGDQQSILQVQNVVSSILWIADNSNGCFWKFELLPFEIVPQQSWQLNPLQYIEVENLEHHNAAVHTAGGFSTFPRQRAAVPPTFPAQIAIKGSQVWQKCDSILRYSIKKHN